MDHLLAKNMKGVADNAEILQTFSCFALKTAKYSGQYVQKYDWISRQGR